jgi:hypothetical protein
LSLNLTTREEFHHALGKAGRLSGLTTGELDMRLTMRNSNDLAQDLPFGDNVIDTGNMGDCVSVIVMWNWVGPRAGNMRGFHGFGGIRAVNWTSLFANVPDDADAFVYILAGPLNSQRDNSLVTGMEDARRAAPDDASFVIYHGIASATVDRVAHITVLAGNPVEMEVYGGRYQFASTRVPLRDPAAVFPTRRQLYWKRDAFLGGTGHGLRCGDYEKRR